MVVAKVSAKSPTVVTLKEAKLNPDSSKNLYVLPFSKLIKPYTPYALAIIENFVWLFVESLILPVIPSTTLTDNVALLPTLIVPVSLFV